MEYFHEFKEYIKDIYNYYFYIWFIKDKYDHKIFIKDIVDVDEINKIINEAHLEIKLDKELQVLEKRFSELKDDEIYDYDENENNNNDDDDNIKLEKKICLLK